MSTPKYQGYCRGYTNCPRFASKKEARKWARSIAKDMRWYRSRFYSFTRLDSGEEHWRVETGSTLDCVGFRPI